jgi:hypothetical protein
MSCHIALEDRVPPLAEELAQRLTAVTNYLQGCRLLLEDGRSGSAAVILAAVELATYQALRAGELIRNSERVPLSWRRSALLEPQNQIGPASAQSEDRGEQAERTVGHKAIARRSGERIIAQPVCVLDAIIQQQSTFTRQDMADAEQFAQALAKVEALPQLVRVSLDGPGRERFSTREMLDVERSA